MRAFVAIHMDEDVQDTLARVQDELPFGRLTPPENLHLTLAFLDDQPGDALEALHEGLEAVRLPAFDLTLRGLDTFGGAVPSVLFAAAERAEPLVALHKAVRGAARQAGIDLPRDRFRPHVTLARFSRHMEPGQVLKLVRVLQEHGDWTAPTMLVRGFTLFGSTLTPEGAVHEPLAEYPLQ